MSVLAEDTQYDHFGSTIGGSSDFGGIAESGGTGSRISADNSNTVNPDGSVNLSVPEPPKSPIIPIVVGFFALKYLGVL